MSAFYLDILKDRVYTSRRDSLERRSAQTVMYLILDSLVKLMAPVLSFTADEVWWYMPKQTGDERPSGGIPRPGAGAARRPPGGALGDHHQVSAVRSPRPWSWPGCRRSSAIPLMPP